MSDSLTSFDELADFIEANFEEILKVTIVGVIGPYRDTGEYARAWSRCTKLAGNHIAHIVDDLRARSLDPHLYERGCVANEVLSDSSLAPLVSFFEGRRAYGSAIAAIALELPSIDRERCNRLLSTLEDYLFASIRLNAQSFFNDMLTPNFFRRTWHGQTEPERSTAKQQCPDNPEKANANHILESDGDSLTTHPDKKLVYSLTERERAIALLVVQGLTNSQIAERLCVSVGTVKNHLGAIYSKLGVDGRTGLVVLMSERHELKGPPHQLGLS